MRRGGEEGKNAGKTGGKLKKKTAIVNHSSDRDSWSVTDVATCSTVSQRS